MRTTVRNPLRKICTVALATAALGGALMVQGSDGTSSRVSVAHPAVKHKLDLSDVLRISLAAGDRLHLRFAGITTGTPNADHSTDIPLQSFQFGVGRGVAGGTTGNPRTVSLPNLSEITVTHQFDDWSAKLLNSSIRGTANSTTHTPTASLYFSQSDASSPTGFRDYLQIDLKEVVISGYSMSTGGGTPSESVSLNFSNVMTVTTRSIPGGAVQTVTYNLTTQT